MDKFLETHNLSKLKDGALEILNSEESESGIKNLLTTITTKPRT
jgi:hypothetical protein